MADDPAAGEVPAPDSPQAVALAWVEAAVDRADLASAWPLTDPTLRLVLAQEWIWRHSHELPGGGADGRDELATALAEVPSDHPLWPRFATDLMAGWQRVWKGFKASTWGTLDRTEIVSLDLELVTFVETGGARTSSEATGSPFARRFLVRHTADGWLVAGLDGERVFRPGWPPAPG
jgi:hypothetical protein